jgi:hypothetical protein
MHDVHNLLDIWQTAFVLQGHCSSTLKKISATHVFKLGFAPNSYPATHANQLSFAPIVSNKQYHEIKKVIWNGNGYRQDADLG